MLYEVITIILEDYPAREAQAALFERPIKALTERLGKQKVESLLAYLQQGAWRELVRELMVDYYDPLYQHTYPERRVEIDMASWDDGLEQLKREVATLVEAKGA